MAVRATMADLIAKVRQLIGDKSVTPNFTDQEIQDALDTRRDVVRYQPLLPAFTPAPNTGIVQYLDYYGTLGYWESDAALFGAAWQPLTTATQDYITGHWTFASSQIPTVWITGNIYDMYGVCADLLEAWAAQTAGDFDFSTQSRKYSRSQVTPARMKLAEQYREKAWAVSVRQIRDDVVGDNGFPDAPQIWGR